MAKDDDFDDLDDFDLDSDFDIESMGVDDDPKSRNPVTRAMGKGGQALFDSTLNNEAVRERLVTDALPKSVNSAYRNTQAVKDEVDKTLDHLEKEFRDSKRDAMAAGRAVLPMVKPFLPASITRKITEFTRDDDRWEGGEVDRDSAEIAAALDGIFGGQNPADARREQKEEQVKAAADMVEEQATKIKQDSMLQHIINIDDGVKTVTAFNAQTVNYRRKMMELGYRQWFTQRDLLKANVEAYDKIIPALEAITKNTALPDYAKEEFGEITGALMKRNIIEKISPLNWSRNYHKYIGTAVRNKISEFASTARQAFSMMQMGGSMMEDSDDSEITGDELKQNYMDQGATVAGGLAGDWVNEKVLGPMAGKIRGMLFNNPTAMKYLSTYSTAMSNKPAFLNAVRADPNAPWILKKAASMIDALGVAGPSDLSRVDFETETVESLGKASALTRQTTRAIERVIPGFLAKLDQSVRRIYEPNAALEMYDYERDKFVTMDSWKKFKVSRTQTDAISRSLNNNLDGFFYEIGRGSESVSNELKKVNDRSRDIIKKAIEITTREHCTFFDAMQMGGTETIPHGIDPALYHALSQEEQGDLVTAIGGIFDIATQGKSERKRAGIILSIKNSLNKYAQNHYGASSSLVADSIRNDLKIYGIGVVSQTDLVQFKKETHRTRPDYYIGTKLVIRSSWFDKGRYWTPSEGQLVNLRTINSEIRGPLPDGKMEANNNHVLVSIHQLPHLTTREGEHYLTVENSLDFGDDKRFRVNPNLFGTSALTKDKSKDWSLGSESDGEFDSAEYTDSGAIEESVKLNNRQRKKRRNNRNEDRSIQRESENLRNGAAIRINKLNAEMSGVETRLDRILDQLIHNNVQEQLAGIRQDLADHVGIAMYSMNMDPKIREKFAAAREKANRAFRHLKVRGKLSRRWVGKKIKGAEEWLSKHDLSLNPFKLATKLGGGAYRAVTDFGKAILGKRDILDAMGNVVISALDIQSRRLYTLDEKNQYKLITKISDIKGGVYRLSEDGTTYNEVFSPDAIAAKFHELCYSTETGIRKLASDVGGWAGDRLRKLHHRGNEIVTKFTGFGKNVVKSAWGVIAYIPDIYYSLDKPDEDGKTKPRLLARVAKEGGYLDVKTGKEVRYFSDIHGEVRDLKGNVCISEDEFNNPEGRFIDGEGNDVTSLLSSIGAAARNIRNKIAKGAKSFYGAAKDAAGYTQELFMNALGGLANLFGKGGFVVGQRLVVQRLEQIYILLNDRMKGSGRGGPLPFEPMTDDKLGLGGWSWFKRKPKADAPKGEQPKGDGKPGESYSEAMQRVLNTPIDELLGKGKAKAETAKNKASKVAKDVKDKAKNKFFNYTDNFCNEYSKLTGVDPRVAYADMLTKLGTTKEAIVSETGIDQALLDLALLSKEFETIHELYKTGQLSTDEYKARVAELAANSPYHDVYRKTMGFFARHYDEAMAKVKAKMPHFEKPDGTIGFGERAKEAMAKSRKSLGEITQGIKDRVKNWRNGESEPEVTDPAEKEAVEAKEKETEGKVGFARRMINAYKRGGAAGKFTDDLINDVIKDLKGLRKKKDEGDEEAEAEEQSKAKDPTTRKAGILNYVTTKFGFRGDNIKVGANGVEDSEDTDGDGERDNSFAAKMKKRAKDGFFKNFSDMFGKMYKGKDENDPKKPSLLQKLGAFIGPMISKTVGPFFTGLLETFFTGAGGLMSLAKSFVMNLIARPAGLLLTGARIAGTAALSAAGALGGAALGAAAAVVTNPVTWIAAGTALALYGAYKSYKWATADRLPKIDQLRIASYGAEDYSRLDLTDTQKSLYLEDAMSRYVSYDANGNAVIKQISGDNMLKLIQGWGIEATDREAINVFYNWFKGRFLPVYSIWLTAAKQHLGVEKLKDIGNEKSFKHKDMVKVAKATRLTKSSPIWSVTIGPYDDEDMIGFDDVDELFADTIKDWEAKYTDKEMYGGGMGGYDPYKNAKPGTVPGTEPETEFELLDRKSMFSFNDRAGNSDEISGKMVYNSTVYSTTGYIPDDDGFRHVKNTTDALTAVRLRLYGCWDLTTRNVDRAFAIEDMVLPDLNAENNELKYKGNLKLVYEKAKGLGGLSKNYSEESFKYWFDKLFLPVLVAYIGAVNKHLNAKDPFKIPNNGGNKGFLIAKAMWGAKTDQLCSKPFENTEIDTYSLAMDFMKSSMATLEEVQKAHKVKEQGSKSDSAKATPEVSDAQQKVMNATSGQYTLDENGKVVLTERGKQNTTAPWRPGNQANNGPGGAPSNWGTETPDDVAHAGSQGPLRPPAPSPKRDEAEQQLIKAAIEAGITDPNEIAMLLAHAAHESGGFKFVEENLNYSSDRLLQIFPRYFSAADAKKYGRDPVAIGNIAYGKRMGNKDPGDGYKYRGRGFMQLTGRNNYEALAKKYPKARDPDWVSTPEGAAASAVYWWTSIAKGSIRNLAKKGDVLGTTKIVNGGTNGLADRRNQFAWYQQQIKSGKIKIDPQFDTSESGDSSGLAGAQREAVPNAVDTMKEGAGVDSPSSESPGLSPAAKAASEAPERPTGAPEDVAAKNIGNAVAEAVPQPAPQPKPAPAPQPTPSAPAPTVSQDPIDREGAAVKKRAAEHVLAGPVDELVKIGNAQLQILQQIAGLLGGQRPGASGSLNTPVSMTR